MAQDAVFINTVLNSWKQIIERTDKTFASFSDDQLQLEVAPDRNRVFYLLGHLTVVHDRLFPLLRFGERLYPGLDDEFVTNPDRAIPTSKVSPAELRKAWSEVNDRLVAAMEMLRPDEWLEKHSSVSEEDFAKEPLRNRLAVLLSRTNHAALHEGQIRLAHRT